MNPLLKEFQIDLTINNNNSSNKDNLIINNNNNNSNFNKGIKTVASKNIPQCFRLIHDKNGNNSNKKININRN